MFSARNLEASSNGGCRCSAPSLTGPTFAGFNPKMVLGYWGGGLAQDSPPTQGMILDTENAGFVLRKKDSFSAKLNIDRNCLVMHIAKPPSSLRQRKDRARGRDGGGGGSCTTTTQT